MPSFGSRETTQWNQAGLQDLDAGFRAYMLGTYNWMTSGLLVTAMTAWLISSTSLADMFYHVVRTSRGLATSPTLLGWITMLSPLAFTMVMSLGWQKMNKTTLGAVFWAFSVCMGASLSSMAAIYTSQSVTVALLITTSMFAAASIWGLTTGADLSRMGNILMMGLVGLVVASLVNLFVGSGIVSTVISAVAVVLFTAMTVWETQRMKDSWHAGLGAEVEGKASLMSALSLYLNFVNIFTSLLQLTGTRRN